MKISTKGRYALRMLVDISDHATDSFISLKEISDRQNISKKYLEQIVPLLTKNGILRTNRGNKGGYALARTADEISVGEVLRATEGSLAPVACLEYETNDCPRAGICDTLFVWEGLQKVITEYLNGITIAMIAAIPMMIPSMVRSERILCENIPWKDSLMFSSMIKFLQKSFRKDT